MIQEADKVINVVELKPQVTAFTPTLPSFYEFLYMISQRQNALAESDQ